MSDLIDRRDAIDALVKLTNCNGVRELYEYVQEHHLSDMWSGGIVDAIDAVIRVPSAQPEQRWIPCSERMPDEQEWFGTKKFGTTISNEVYVTFETPDGQRFAEHINFQNGKLSPADEQRMKVWFKGAKPIAWMPLPEPYKERREE